MNRIKKILEEQGRSQKWLSDRIDRSYVVVNNYTNNKAQPSIPVLYHMSYHLDVNVGELLDNTIKVGPLQKEVKKSKHRISKNKRGRPKRK